MKTLTVEKPWGRFEQFSKNEDTTVKLIFLKPNSSLSLQFHKKRSEFWRIISGHPVITIGESKTTANPGDEFNIKQLEKHRIETEGEEAAFLEISYGEFDEEDIVRVEDKYGRVS